MNYNDLEKLTKEEFLRKIGHISDFEKFCSDEESEKYPNLVSKIKDFLENYKQNKNLNTTFSKKSAYLFELIWDALQDYKSN